jgi:hypothetical protein
LARAGVKGPSNRPSRKNGGQPSAKPARGCNAHAKFVVLHDLKGIPRLLLVGVGHLAEGEGVSREDAKARRVLHRELKENLLLLRCFAASREIPDFSVLAQPAQPTKLVG